MNINNNTPDIRFNGFIDDWIEGKVRDEPPRLYRRVIYLSQAAMPDRIKLS